MPFYKKLEGQPSNSLHIQTLEDVPSAPPTNIRSEMINKTSASLSWAPPPPQHRNGILKGKVTFLTIRFALGQQICFWVYFLGDCIYLPQSHKKENWFFINPCLNVHQ